MNVANSLASKGYGVKFQHDFYRLNFVALIVNGNEVQCILSHFLI